MPSFLGYNRRMRILLSNDDGYLAPGLAALHEALKPIEGLPPDLIDLPSGCAFHPRCPFAIEKCTRDVPPLNRVGETQLAACWVTQSGTELPHA